MKSSVVKRSVTIVGHKTSVSPEDPFFWNMLKCIADGRNTTLADLVASIDAKREHANLSSAIRLFILNCLCIEIDEETGARKALSAVGTASPAECAQETQPHL